MYDTLSSSEKSDDSEGSVTSIQEEDGISVKKSNAKGYNRKHDRGQSESVSTEGEYVPSEEDSEGDGDTEEEKSEEEDEDESDGASTTSATGSDGTDNEIFTEDEAAILKADLPGILAARAPKRKKGSVVEPILQVDYTDRRQRPGRGNFQDVPFMKDQATLFAAKEKREKGDNESSDSEEDEGLSYKTKSESSCLSVDDDEEDEEEEMCVAQSRKKQKKLLPVERNGLDDWFGGFGVIGYEQNRFQEYVTEMLSGDGDNGRNNLFTLYEVTFRNYILENTSLSENSRKILSTLFYHEVCLEFGACEVAKVPGSQPAGKILNDFTRPAKPSASIIATRNALEVTITVARLNAVFGNVKEDGTAAYFKRHRALSPNLAPPDARLVSVKMQNLYMRSPMFGVYSSFGTFETAVRKALEKDAEDYASKIFRPYCAVVKPGLKFPDKDTLEFELEEKQLIVRRRVVIAKKDRELFERLRVLLRWFHTVDKQIAFLRQSAKKNGTVVSPEKSAELATTCRNSAQMLVCLFHSKSVSELFKHVWTAPEAKKRRRR